MSNEVPAGLVILVNDKAYMTVRNWTDEIGNAAIGIGKEDEVFENDDQVRAFRMAVSSPIGRDLEEIVGSVVVPESEEAEIVPQRPSLCAFRVARDGPVFVARWLRHHGLAQGQTYSVLALMDENAQLMTKFRESLGEKRAGREHFIDYDNFLRAPLVPVYSSVTVTREIVRAGASGSGADSAGDGGD